MIRSAVVLAIALGPAHVRPLAAQLQRAPSPPAPAPWVHLPSQPPLDLFPLVAYNDRDGVVAGGWIRWTPDGDTRLWMALGGGGRELGRAPSILEASAESGRLHAWFKHTEGRRGFGASYTLDLAPGWTLTAAAEEAALVDGAYLRRIFYFDCAADAPAAPCDSVRAPSTWSRRPDRAAELRVVRGGDSLRWGVALRGAPGLLGAEPAYAQLRAEALWAATSGKTRLETRLALGWATRETPLQSRFLAHGTGPLERWAQPLLRSRGAPFDRVSYFAPGGAHLRAYGRTAPLLRRFLSAAAQAARPVELPLRLSGRVGAFVEAAWVPGAPDAYGRDDITETAAVLIDWSRLTPGEEKAGGRFSAGALDLPEAWADAGVAAAVRLPFDLEVELALPLWASAASLADRAHDLLDPFGGGEDRALGLRWTLSVAWALGLDATRRPLDRF